MEKQIVKLASEKSFNKNIFPVKNIKGKPLPEGIFADRPQETKFWCINGPFGEKEMMIMDILGTIAIHNTYYPSGAFTTDFSKIIPTMSNPNVKKISEQYISEKLLKYFIDCNIHSDTDVIPRRFFGDGGYIPKEIDGTNERIKILLPVCFVDADLKRQLPFLKKYTSKNLFELIKRTSECEFRMYYPIRFFNGEKYQNHPYVNAQYNSRLFRIVDVKEHKISKDGKVLERSYEIHFDTFLGYFYMQNILSCYTDLVPGHFYEMSSYAQLLYRLLILPYFGTVKNPISLKEIKYRLVLKSENYMTRKTIMKNLRVLEKNGFISNPTEIPKNGTYYYQYKLAFDSRRYTKMEKPRHSRDIATHPKWCSAYKIRGWI